ncbi:membrane protein insertase YidC [Thalassotalea sp. PS06]|uniref:membrane protein insertase YidC n=1 Tax=Thalassotalea sp. PS06 TaxID=2594005 RepID=UPI001165390F|nr:membrane protein insertase YidC [Thalassotalea sp. PS06]QDP02839.1 membrane protein insertase YidC [Thalassotalea sp. PS06]
MESQRGLLFIALLVVSFLLFQQWQVDNAPQPPVETQTASQSPEQQSGDDDFIPQANEQAPTAQNVSGKGGIITIASDVLELKINTRGGDIEGAKLLQYETEQGSGEAMPILTNSGFTYVAQSGLVGAQGDSKGNKRATYVAEKTEYKMSGESLVVDLTHSNNGIDYIKRFTLKQGKYDVDVEYIVKNNNAIDASVTLFGQLKQDSYIEDDGSMFMPTYRGTAYNTSETRYEKLPFDDIEESNLNTKTKAGWVAMLQHYFVSAWVPNKTTTNEIYSSYNASKGQAIIGFKQPSVTIAPGSTETVSAVFYVGPKDQKALEDIAEDLNLTVDYGPLWFISEALFALLIFIQSGWINFLGLIEIDLGFGVGNWGIAIIITTIIVKMFLYPLTKAQYTSMAKMRKVQPKMQALKERYGDDRQKMSQAMMELYKKEKVNPAGGCLPLLIQMPIFLALYWVFMESVELRHAPFVLWITDLSSMDPYFVLPLLMGASMWLMQKLQPNMATDPMQQKMMQWMPVFFTFFFLWFPSGLVLYWLASNLITIVQMLWIFREIEKSEEQGKAKASKK